MNCPHCNAEVPSGVQFCTSCGKAVAVGSSSPRVVNEEKGVAASVAGQSMQADALRKTMKKAFTGLVVVAVLQGLALALFLVMFTQATKPEERSAMLILSIVVGVIFVGFVGLAAWSRYQPFPAAVTGLVILGTLWAIDIIADPASIMSGILIKIIVLAMLIRSVQAGLAHRKLAREIAVSRAALT